MRLLITGSRDWQDREFLTATLDKFVNDIEVLIEGEARGADVMCRDWALANNIEVLRFPADWEAFGKAAGPIRNKQMLVEGKPDFCIAFSKDLANSKGTKNMVEQALKAGITVLNAWENETIEPKSSVEKKDE